VTASPTEAWQGAGAAVDAGVNLSFCESAMDVRLRPQVLFYNVDLRLSKHPGSKNPNIVAEAVLADPENAEAGALRTQSACCARWLAINLAGTCEGARHGQRSNRKGARTICRSVFANVLWTSKHNCVLCAPQLGKVDSHRTLRGRVCVRHYTTSTHPSLNKARRREWEAPGLHHCGDARGLAFEDCLPNIPPFARPQPGP